MNVIEPNAQYPTVNRQVVVSLLGRTFFVMDLIDQNTTNNIPGFLFFIVFEKTFVCIDWEFIDHTHT